MCMGTSIRCVYFSFLHLYIFVFSMLLFMELTWGLCWVWYLKGLTTKYTPKKQQCLFSLIGNFVSTKYNLSGGYIPSFQKKEVGSVGQRIQLAPLVGQHASKDLFHLCQVQFLSYVALLLIILFPSENYFWNHHCIAAWSASYLTIMPPFLYSVCTFSLAVFPSKFSFAGTTCSSFFTLSVKLSSSPDNKNDKPKAAKLKPTSNSSLSDTNEGIVIFS